MANKFIYFLIIVAAYSRSLEAYFLNEELETNLPERYGDPIDENWQDKRSAENEYLNDNKESSDGFAYRNGNAKMQVADDVGKWEPFVKRESKMDRNDDEVFRIFFFYENEFQNSF